MTTPPALDPEARRRVALYDAAGKAVAILHADLKTITANLPKGGSWKDLPDGVRAVGQVPPAT